MQRLLALLEQDFGYDCAHVIWAIAAPEWVTTEVDWRCCVPEAVKSVWATLSEDARILAFYWAHVHLERITP